MALGVVHGGVGGAQVVIGGREASLAADHPDAGVAGHGVRVDLIGSREGGGNLSGPIGCARLIDTLKQHVELIATHAGDKINSPYAGFKPARKLLQQLVTHMVAKGVIDCLELIEVQQQHGEHGGVALCQRVTTFRSTVLMQRDGVLEAIAEQRPAGQVGQGVVRAAAFRQIAGGTDPVEKATPGTIRADLALVTQDNLVHGSDSPESAAREIALWFPGLTSA